MKKAISPDLIRKYIGGACTPEEVEAVHQWYVAFENEPDPIIDLETKAQLELKMRMLGQIRSNIQAFGSERRNKRAKIMLYNWIGSAAAVLFVMLGLIFYKSDFKRRHQERATGIIRDSNEVVIDNQSHTILKHVLSDGSTIWLSPLARIEYKKGFNLQIRKVVMTGEAFFEVTKDKNRPFVIYGGGVITKVWGTSFSIATGKGATATQVAVLTGKVSVKVEALDGEELMLLPNQKAVYLKADHELSKNSITSSESVNMWKKEDISFDNIPVTEIIKVLNTKFGVNITVGDGALSHYMLKADFTGQSLPEVLLMMEKSLNITYTIDQKNIVLHQKISK
ncbi:fec operon regulator FecR [compost metagenome]